MAIKVGDTIWLFDVNRRVYRKGPDGRSLPGGPIYRDHFEPRVVSGESPRCWYIGEGRGLIRVRKENMTFQTSLGTAKAYGSQQEVDEAVFLHDHAYKIGHKATECRDVETLKKIAELIGYDYTEDPHDY